MATNDSKVRRPKAEPDAEENVKKKEAKPLGTRKKIEKTQISVRIDKKIMDSYYDMVELDGTRITDLIEEGLLLAMRARLKRPLVIQQARYLIDNSTLDEAWFHVLFAAYLRTPSDTLSIYNSADRENTKKKLLMLGAQSYFREVLDTYGHVPGVPEPPTGSAADGLRIVAKADLSMAAIVSAVEEMRSAAASAA